MRLSFKKQQWDDLIADLRARGQGRRESGAFLLGRVRPGVKEVVMWLPYDEMDPSSLNYDYVRIRTLSFSKLWNSCEANRLVVVGDIHTHPLGPRQSPSDKANPMVSVAGHIALIAPRFAIGNVAPIDVSVNVYLGAGKWASHEGQQAASLIVLS